MYYEDTFQGMLDESRATTDRLRAEVERLTARLADLEAERDHLSHERDEWMGIAQGNGRLADKVREERDALRAEVRRLSTLPGVFDARPAPNRSGTYTEHIQQLEKRVYTLTEERDNARQEVQQLRTELHDTLNELQIARWGRYATPLENSAVGQEGEPVMADPMVFIGRLYEQEHPSGRVAIVRVMEAFAVSESKAREWLAEWIVNHKKAHDARQSEVGEGEA